MDCVNCAIVPLLTLNEAVVDGAIAGDVDEVIVVVGAIVAAAVVLGDDGDGLIVVAAADHYLMRNGFGVQGTEQCFHEQQRWQRILMNS